MCCKGYARNAAKRLRTEMFLKVRFLAKPKRINSLWSFGLTKSFVFNRRLAAARHSPSELGLCARLAQTFIDIYHSVHSAGVLQNARKNAPFQSTLIYAIFSPKTPAHPSLIHVSICFQVVYVCIVEASNQSQPSISVLGCFFVYNTRPPKNSEADIFCYPRAIFS